MATLRSRRDVRSKDRSYRANPGQSAADITAEAVAQESPATCAYQQCPV